MDAYGQQSDRKLLPVRGNGDRIGYRRCGEVAQTVDRARGRHYVAAGADDDLLGRLVAFQSETHPDACHQRPEGEVDGQHRRILVDFERGLPDVRVHEVVVGQILRTVGCAPRVVEDLVYGVERGSAAVRIVCRRQRVAAYGHVAGKGGCGARFVGREFELLRRGAVVEEYGDFVALHPSRLRAVYGGAGFAGDRILWNGYLNVFRLCRSRRSLFLAACAHAGCGEHRYNE